MYSVDDIVTLTAARGGWQGVISSIVSLGHPELYRVENLDQGDPENGSVTVSVADIASSHTDYPDWQPGQQVTLYKLTGQIKAIDGRYISVEITQTRSPEVTFERLHIVPRWRLLIENNT
jgi:hypothetical protein